MAAHAHRDDIDYNSLHSQPDAVDFYAAISRQPARKNINEARRKRIIKYVIFAAVCLAVLAGVFAAVGTTTEAKNKGKSLTTSEVMGASPELMLAAPNEQQEYQQDQAVLDNDEQDAALAQVDVEEDKEDDTAEKTGAEEDTDEDALLVQGETEGLETDKEGDVSSSSSSSSSSTSASSTFTAPAVLGAVKATTDLFDSSSSSSTTTDDAAGPTPIVKAVEQNVDVPGVEEDEPLAEDATASDMPGNEVATALLPLDIETETEETNTENVEEINKEEEQAEAILADVNEKMRKRHFQHAGKNRLVARSFKH